MNLQPFHRVILVLLAMIAFVAWLRSDVHAVQRQFSEGESPTLRQSLSGWRWS